MMIEAPVRDAVQVWRCGQCHRILARVVLPLGGYIQIKCHCNAMNEKDRRP